MINCNPSLDYKCVAVLFIVLLILFIANEIKNTSYKPYKVSKKKKKNQYEAAKSTVKTVRLQGNSMVGDLYSSLNISF